MKMIVGIIYITLGILGLVEVMNMPGTQLVLSFCTGATIGVGISKFIELYYGIKE